MVITPETTEPYVDHGHFTKAVDRSGDLVARATKEASPRLRLELHGSDRLGSSAGFAPMQRHAWE
jgi:hypothetical protein